MFLLRLRGQAKSPITERLPVQNPYFGAEKSKVVRMSGQTNSPNLVPISLAG
jgi:hypothetical protein